MRRHFSTAATAIAALLLVAACASGPNDLTYVPVGHYEEMRELFVQTGSMQRVEEVMDARGWTDSEKRQVRYWLAKDLYLDDLIPEAVPAAD